MGGGPFSHRSPPSWESPDQHERKRLVPYSNMHILRLEKAGKFPKRTRLNNGRVCWSFNEVQAWIAGRLAERSGAGAE